MRYGTFFRDGHQEHLTFDTAELFQHCLVAGRSGSGKSTHLELRAIDAIRSGHGLLFLDPHGSSVKNLLRYCGLRHRNRVCYISADTPVGLNPLYRATNAPLAAQELAGAFKSLFAESYGPRLDWRLFNALLYLMQTPGSTLLDIPKLFTTTPPRNTGIEFWDEEYPSYDKRFNAEANSPILNKVGKLITVPAIRQMLGSGKPRFSVKDALEENLIVLVNLSKGQFGKDGANLLGSILLSQVHTAAFNRTSREPFHVIVDEFHSFTTTAVSDMIAELRKFAVSLTLGTQWLSQLSDDTQEAVLNVGTLVLFRLSATDAQRVAREVQRDAAYLSDLRPFTAYVKRGAAFEEYEIKTLPLPPPAADNTEKVLRASSRRFGV